MPYAWWTFPSSSDARVYLRCSLSANFCNLGSGSGVEMNGCHVSIESFPSAITVFRRSVSTPSHISEALTLHITLTDPHPGLHHPSPLCAGTTR